MGAIASQITSLMIVYSTVYPDADQRKHQSSASLAFVRGFHRYRWIPRTKGQWRGQCFHLMTSSCNRAIHNHTMAWHPSSEITRGLCSFNRCPFTGIGIPNPIDGLMMTSSNGNIFRVTGPLCGEFTGPGEFPAQRPVTRSFDVFFDLCLNKRLSKQPWGGWFETPLRSFWRHCNDMGISTSTKTQDTTRHESCANFGDKFYGNQIMHATVSTLLYFSVWRDHNIYVDSPFRRLSSDAKLRWFLCSEQAAD